MVLTVNMNASAYRGFLVLACALLLIQSVSTSFSAGNLQVNTSSGPVRGESVKLPNKKTVIRFLGIRFAQAERFEAPIPAKPWKTTLNATTYGNSCPQNVNIEVGSTRDMSEDCLFLNIFAPSTANGTSSLPVMVWIYGGGYTDGTASGSYDGCILATEGEVIVVTLNYRLGVLGFLSAGSDTEIRGNLGLLDQVEALRWVKKNIDSFGGDAQNVTLFGQSAGGGSVAHQMLSPLSRGLFDKVILESGTAIAAWSFVEIQTAISGAKNLARYFHCGDVTTLKSCLKKVPFDDIVSAQVNLTDRKELSLGPVVDHYFMLDSPMKLLNDGNFSKVAVMMGVTKDEGAFWLFTIKGFHKGILRNFTEREIDMNYFKALVKGGTWTERQNEQVLESIFYEYTDWTHPGDRQIILQQYVDLFSDSSFKAPAILSANAFIDQNLETYFYCFDHRRHSKHFPNWVGVYHTAELLFVFGTLIKYNIGSENDTDIIFTKKVIQWWTNFAKTGNPTPHVNDSVARDDFVWPRYSADKQQYAVLAPNVSVGANMLPEKMAFWNEFIPRINPPTSPSPTSTEKPTRAPGDTKTQTDKKTVYALIAVVVVLCVAVVVLVFLAIWFRRNSAIAKGEPGASAQLM